MQKLMTIGEVATRLGRSVDFIRTETDAGRLKAEPRKQNEQRRYREVAVIAYESRYGRGTKSAPTPRPAPAAPPRPAVVRRAPPPPPVDEWEDDLEQERGPLVPTSQERVYLNNLVVNAMSEAPYDLPGDWRAKLHADLEEYITIERFPYPESEQTAMRAIRLHTEGFLHGYRESKRKEEEKRLAKDAAERAEIMKVHELIAYGKRLLELDLSQWVRGDPINEARREVETVLAAEVKADWTEGDVRDVVKEVLAEYDPDANEEGDD